MFGFDEFSRVVNKNEKKLAKFLNLDKSILSRTIDGLVKNGQKTSDVINRESDAYYEQALKQIPRKNREQIIENIAILAQAFLDYESQLESRAECCKTTQDRSERGK